MSPFSKIIKKFNSKQMKQFKTFLFLTILPLLLNASPLISLGENHSENIVLNNSILSKVNGKAISALDVMKRMDFLFYQLFPNLTDSTTSRYQFYQANWKSILKEMVDRELIVADAKEKQLPISDGDIREEMEELFGPNVIDNIDRLELSYDEVWQMIKTNITVRRMLLYRVNSKAIASVNPRDMQEAYKGYIAENVLSPLWRYRVITIKDPDPEKAKNIADLSFSLLEKKQSSFFELPEKIKKENNHFTGIALSEELQHSDKSISNTHKEILSTLVEGSYSTPIKQISRTTNVALFRIFYLEEYVEKKVPPFAEVEEKIKELLIENAIAQETEAYLKKLRKHYSFDNDHLNETASLETQLFSLY